MALMLVDQPANRLQGLAEKGCLTATTGAVLVDIRHTGILACCPVRLWSTIAPTIRLIPCVRYLHLGHGLGVLLASRERLLKLACGLKQAPALHLLAYFLLSPCLQAWKEMVCGTVNQSHLALDFGRFQ